MDIKPGNKFIYESLLIYVLMKDSLNIKQPDGCVLPVYNNQ